MSVIRRDDNLETVRARRAITAPVAARLVAAPAPCVFPPGDSRHGRASTYTNHRCRCPACRADWADYHRVMGYGTRYYDRKKGATK